MYRDEREYEAEMQRQRDELAELSAERQRLLMMQQHLLKLQESLAAATTAAAQVTHLLPIDIELFVSINTTAAGSIALTRQLTR